MNGRIVEIVEHNLLHYQRMEMRKTLQQRTHKRDDCKHKRKITYSIFMIACAGCKDAAVSCAIFRRKFGRANVIFASEPANNRTEIADHGKMNSTSLAVAVKFKLHERVGKARPRSKREAEMSEMRWSGRTDEINQNRFYDIKSFIAVYVHYARYGACFRPSLLILLQKMAFIRTPYSINKIIVQTKPSLEQKPFADF